MSISKNSAKLIRALHLKKYRKEQNLFLVEGEKSIVELVPSDFNIISLYITQEVFDKYKNLFSKLTSKITLSTPEELTKLSSLEFNDTGIAVVEQKPNKDIDSIKDEIVLVLDDIKDPGNLGTIIRTADWYGITKIVCSETTAEFYNNKVIAASMGSFTRVEVFYTELGQFLRDTKIPVLGAYLDGQDVHNYTYPKSGILLMGSESNGISQSLENYVTNKITIPKYGNAESLNVSIATSIILDNWKRSL